MAQLTQRVYHPTVNAWQDVPKARAKEWTEAGWKTDKPDHVDDSAQPFVPVEGPTDAKAGAKVVAPALD